MPQVLRQKFLKCGCAHLRRHGGTICGVSANTRQFVPAMCGWAQEGPMRGWGQSASSTPDSCQRAIQPVGQSQYPPWLHRFPLPAASMPSAGSIPRYNCTYLPPPWKLKGGGAGIGPLLAMQPGCKIKAAGCWGSFGFAIGKYLCIWILQGVGNLIKVVLRSLLGLWIGYQA